MCLDNLKATAKASQTCTVPHTDVYLINALSSAFLASHCFVTPCFMFYNTLPSSENSQHIKRASVSTETTFVHLRELSILKNEFN